MAARPRRCVRHRVQQQDSNSSGGAAAWHPRLRRSTPRPTATSLRSRAPGTCSGATGGAVLGPGGRPLPAARRRTDHSGPRPTSGCTDRTPAAAAGDDGGGTDDDGGGGTPATSATAATATTAPPCTTRRGATTTASTTSPGSRPQSAQNAAGVLHGRRHQARGRLAAAGRRDRAARSCRPTRGPTWCSAAPTPSPTRPPRAIPSPSVAPGTYVVGPVVFDQPGNWVFRFHFNEECLDVVPESPARARRLLHQRPVMAATRTRRSAHLGSPAARTLVVCASAACSSREPDAPRRARSPRTPYTTATSRPARSSSTCAPVRSPPSVGTNRGPAAGHDRRATAPQSTASRWTWSRGCPRWGTEPRPRRSPPRAAACTW